MVTAVGIAKLVEEYRPFLPDGFLEERDAIEADLAGGRSVDQMQAKGKGSAENRAISKLILAELSLLLCTEDPRYTELRQGAHVVEMTVASAIGRVVSSELGLSQDTAIACVLLLWQVCRRVGVDNFCRLCPPRSNAGGDPEGDR